MRISELSNDEASGNLAGLGTLGVTQAQMDARRAGPTMPIADVKASQPARLLTSGGAPIVLRPTAGAPLHQSDINEGKTIDTQGNVVDRDGNLIEDASGNVYGQVMTYGERAPFRPDGGFIDNLMAAVRRQPALFAAGAALFIVGFLIIVPKLRARMSSGGSPALAPVQVMGLGAGPKKKRKSRKSKKA